MISDRTPLRPPPLPADAPPPASAADTDLAQALEATRAELIACQRLALLGSLAAMVAHEYNNLMTPLIVRVEAALNGGDAAFARKALERTFAQAQRAIQLSRHLIDLSRRTYEPNGASSVAGAVQEAVETLGRPFEKDGVELRLSVPGELHVLAPDTLFTQVLLNLLLNARNAMKGMRGVLAVNAAPDGEFIQIDVRDSGRGLPRETIDNVFNPFLAADPTAQPNDWQEVGLGLSVCRLIARQHNATIRVLPNEGPGCTFRVRWPRAK